MSTEVFNIDFFPVQGSKAVHKKAHLVKLKGKCSTYYGAIGYTILIIQFEGYLGVNHNNSIDLLTDRCTA